MGGQWQGRRGRVGEKKQNRKVENLCSEVAVGTQVGIHGHERTQQESE